LKTQDKNISVLYMLLCAFLWSIAGIFIKMIPWNPLVIAGFRSLIASGVVLLYIKAKKIKFILNKASIISGIMLCLTFMAFVTANKLTTSANTIVLQYTAPVFIMIISVVLFKQGFKKADYWTVGFTILGIALCFFDQLSAGGLWGNIIAVASGLFLAGMYVATGRADYQSRISGILLGQIFTAIIGLSMIFIFPVTITRSALVNIAILGIFQLGIPYIIYGIAANNCSPLVACLVGALEPLLNPIWVLLFDGETPGGFTIIGGIMVIAAVTLWNLRDIKHKA
jgi:drug/metabolite transporter (DMT)-like permease